MAVASVALSISTLATSDTDEQDEEDASRYLLIPGGDGLRRIAAAAGESRGGLGRVRHTMDTLPNDDQEAAALYVVRSIQPAEGTGVRWTLHSAMLRLRHAAAVQSFPSKMSVTCLFTKSISCLASIFINICWYHYNLLIRITF